MTIARAVASHGKARAAGRDCRSKFQQKNFAAFRDPKRCSRTQGDVTAVGSWSRSLYDVQRPRRRQATPAISGQPANSSTANSWTAERTAREARRKLHQLRSSSVRHRSLRLSQINETTGQDCRGHGLTACHPSAKPTGPSRSARALEAVRMYVVSLPEASTTCSRRRAVSFRRRRESFTSHWQTTR